MLPATYLVAQQAGTPVLSRLVLHETVLFLSLLMAFMGGRIIAPLLPHYINTGITWRPAFNHA